MSLEKSIQNAADALNRYCDLIEKPAAEKPAAEKPAAEKPAAEKPAAEKPAAEKPLDVGKAGVSVSDLKDAGAAVSKAGVSVSDLRKLGTSLVAEGFQKEFIAALGEVGVDKVSSVPEESRQPLAEKFAQILGVDLSEFLPTGK